MRKTGLLYDERYKLHDTGPYHPEMAERLNVIMQGIDQGGLLPRLTRVPAKRAELKWIQAIHTREHIDRFNDLCAAGRREFDVPDNQISPESYEIALLAAGGLMEVARQMMAGEIDNAFCAVRPPGHHAETNRALGFCYFNNVAVAARYLQQAHGIERVMIIDIDVHHGNGTQQIFEEDPSVFYYSIHEHPSFLFPGTGREFDEGTGAGQGYCLNSPMLPGQGDTEYRKAFEQKLFPAIDRFNPQVMILSTGFDAHVDDDMSDIRVTTEGYSWIIERLVEMADRHADGRLISVLEGGYCLERLPELAHRHVAALMKA
jgi:acetoin utilization deacetylase AcuC-like enzyme